MICISDSAARDGIQSLKRWVSTDIKVEILDKLAKAGIKKMQPASFVNPKAVPQVQDAEEVYRRITALHPDLTYTTVIPNVRAAERALKVGVKYLGLGCSATDEHNLANFNMTIDESFEEMKKIIAMKGDATCTFGQICSFVCSFTGPVKPITAIRQLDRALNIGCTELTVCDTTGTANPAMVRALLKEYKLAFPGVPLPTVHFHDTFGMGMANTLAALDMGVENFDTVAGGIGGCPFTPGAMGNLATEDMVGMFEEMGIDTGIDMDKLMEAALFVRANAGNLSNASSHRALAAEKGAASVCMKQPAPHKGRV